MRNGTILVKNDFYHKKGCQEGWFFLGHPVVNSLKNDSFIKAVSNQGE